MTKLIIGLGVAIVVLAVGGFFLTMRRDTAPTDEIRNSASELDVDPNQPIVCSYTKDGTTSTVYIMQDRARINSTSSGENFAAITTGETSYFWNTDTKEGWTYNISDLDASEFEGFDPPTREEIDEEIKSADADCRNESFDTSLYNPPTDVEFTDLSEQISDQLENIPQDIQEQIPEDIRNQIPEEYQQYLE